ncbi:hypothetical protein HYQ45_002540 [Verticillium longisporum]|uniref:Uncharacterized protein n=1 Tax=Verticillium longisporum TaxID=100787 RepID=A0A8I2ZX48_VERLO|nr:hypothetical protein HYQ45_002540 [Verticillium longisporum]
MTMTVASRWLFGGVVLSQLLSLAAAVDLRLYNTDYSCNGNRLICSNIPQQTCCVPRVEYYYSASRLNCDSGMTHYGWQRDGGIGCSRVVVSRRGGSNNCIVQSGVTIFALYGQTWQYNSRKRDGKGERSPSCKASVEPDLVEIDGQYFSLNETVPDAQKDDLSSLDLYHPTCSNSTVLPPFLVIIGFQWLHASIHDSV